MTHPLGNGAWRGFLRKELMSKGFLSLIFFSRGIGPCRTAAHKWSSHQVVEDERNFHESQCFPSAQKPQNLEVWLGDIASTGYKNPFWAKRNAIK